MHIFVPYRSLQRQLGYAFQVFLHTRIAWAYLEIATRYLKDLRLNFKADIFKSFLLIWILNRENLNNNNNNNNKVYFL